MVYLSVDYTDPYGVELRSLYDSVHHLPLYSSMDHSSSAPLLLSSFFSSSLTFICNPFWVMTDYVQVEDDENLIACRPARPMAGGSA